MTTDPGHIAADFVAALTDAELKVFIRDARSPVDPPAGATRTHGAPTPPTTKLAERKHR